MRLLPDTVETLLQSQSGFARKVYDFVPIQEPFTETQIVTAIVRGTGNIPPKTILQACLRDLTNSGLIRSKGGMYQRTLVKEKRAKEKTMPEVSATPTVSPDSVELLRGLADQVLSIGCTLVEQMEKLARSLEETAAKIEQEREVSKVKLDKLHQLQTILNELGKE